ncbi:restriction endonuclease subunit S [Acinetobacter sp. NIPH 2699]|uniref:restriction endonuclease subunit S n=1 Tax=Acinetobacter sp. NIPH 2699 TaxID=2923433 RepID=UPI001F4ADA38|nr:restriction endonuclease subunit S [Acinetobacter sp. NIPH 2699]MCH7336021.1 restriction endonuclease subunit S [Acinetobacter sp. NIPH 2699]
MQKQLEQLDEDYGVEWQEYEIGELFSVIKRGKRLKSLDRIAGIIPFITAGVGKQGLSSYVGNDIEIFPANSLTIDMFGSVFYRSFDYGADDHVTVLVSSEQKYSKYILLYIAPLIEKAISGKFDYSRNFYASDAPEIRIQLPTVNKDGKQEIAFDYIEKFVSTLETERLATLELYMNATGMSSYELDLNEKNALNVLEKVTLKEFRMEDVLVWQKNISELNPLHLDSLTISNELKYPFYGQATVYNGVIEYRHLKAEVLNNKLSKPTILIHSNNQNTVYLDTPFYLKDGHGATSVLQSENLNRMTAQFFMTSIKKVILQKYTYNSKATKIELKNTYISLPVKPDNTPDYDYMSTVISAMQKVVIKNVVDYLDQRIEKTKGIIGA